MNSLALETSRGISPVRGMTTTRAPFIEEAKSRGELFIQQPNDEYSEENHDTWRRLFARMQDRWATNAHPRFIDGVAQLCFDCDRVPRLDDVNKFLYPLTRFQAKAVAGYVPAYLFFDCLRQREFPTTITIRSGDTLDYLPEPDIFHDIAGHVPMHTDQAFADTLVRFGECAKSAAEYVQGIRDEHAKLQALASIIRAMARFFWFTIEFGLMRRPDGERGICVYGSGLLSSHSEIAHCIDSSDVQRVPLQLEWVINQYFEINHFQELLFVADSFDQVFTLIGRLEKMMFDGKLNNVSRGEPEVSEADLASFLQAKV